MIKLGAVPLVRAPSSGLGQEQYFFIPIRVREARNPSNPIPDVRIYNRGTGEVEDTDYKGEAELYVSQAYSYDSTDLFISAEGFDPFDTPNFSYGEVARPGITVLLTRIGETAPSQQFFVGVPPVPSAAGGEAPTEDYWGVPTWGWVVGGLGILGAIALASKSK